MSFSESALPLSVSSAAASDDEEDDMAVFDPVLISINLEALPALALAARKPSLDSSTTVIDCKVLSPPLFGSYNILFPLEFTDGIRWVLKVPSTGHRGRFDDIGSRALVAEAWTMRMLKRETNMPLPEVHMFDASIDNELNCPFILMDFIEGVPLSELWYNQTSAMAKGLVEQFRATILMDLAKAMVQLSKYTFDNGGSLLFDEKGNVIGRGPTKVADLPAMFDRLRQDDPDQSAAFYESGPWIHPREFFYNMMNNHRPPRDKFGQGMLKLLGLFVDWMPYTGNGDVKPQFVLAHPDYSLQNILVSEDGRLCGLVDWDGVAAVPRCVGCERYPSWLTTDWDPNRYTYDATRPNCMDHPLEELDIWRKTYARSIEAALQTVNTRSGKLTEENYQKSGPCPASCIKTTHISLLAETLSIAAKDPMSIDEIMSSLFDRITRITAMDWAGWAPNIEQQGFSSNILEAHNSDTKIVDSIGKSRANATETYNGGSGSGQSEIISAGFATSSSNVNHSLPPIHPGKDAKSTSCLNIIQKALSYAIGLFHKDTDQDRSPSNWWRASRCGQTLGTMNNFQAPTEPSPDVPHRGIFRLLKEIYGLAGWPEYHNTVGIGFRQVARNPRVQNRDPRLHAESLEFRLGPLTVSISDVKGHANGAHGNIAQDLETAGDDTLQPPANADPPQDPTTSSADPIGTPVAEIVVDESYRQYFILWDIVHALADDFLDDAHMKRLKQGFEAIVSSLQQPEELEGYQHLVDQVVEEKAMTSHEGNWVRIKDGT